jgi:acetoin utilization deacetylase AcuC-like enzyme
MIKDIGLIWSPLFLKHESAEPHVENVARLSAIYRLFEEVPEFAELPRLSLERADETDLVRVHAREMVSALSALRGTEGWIDADTYYSPDTLDVAEFAAGSCLKLALEIWRGTYRRGFSLVRPPGHHATAKQPMGFCLFNNIAVAAAGILHESPQARLAIVDFDLHHGNGTQWSFYDNPNVLFISSHRFPFYPGTGKLDEIGINRGKGTKINFPIATQESDDFFLSLYGNLVAPMLKSFRPEMILVSAGFDGHERDPMRGFRISTEGFGRLSEILVNAAELDRGKILFCLEGGYNPDALKESVAVVLKRLVDLPRHCFETETASQSSRLLDDFRAYHSPFFPGTI